MRSAGVGGRVALAETRVDFGVGLERVAPLGRRQRRRSRRHRRRRQVHVLVVGDQVDVVERHRLGRRPRRVPVDDVATLLRKRRQFYYFFGGGGLV